MFELGKKDGAQKNSDHLAQTERQQPQNAKRTDSASATNPTGRREIAVIGRSIRIDGDLQGEEDLRIEGDVTGTVRLHNHTLTIGSEGKVRADVYAKSVIVDGVMEGDLYSSERVEIRKNATLHGNITAPRVSLEDGAKFKGSMEMDSDAVNAAVGASASIAGSRNKTGSGDKSKPGMNGDKPAAKPQVVSRDTAGARESVG